MKLENLSPETVEDLLISLEIIAEARLETIADKEELRKAAYEHYQEILREIQRGHIRANRALLDAIDEANRRGIPRELTYEQIGLSGQRIRALRQQVAAAEKKLDQFDQNQPNQPEEEG